MLLVAAVLEAGHIGIAPWLMNELRQLGQASFFVYVVQFYVYGVVLHALRLPYTAFWPLIFLFTIAMLTLVAAAWNWKEGNRFLTIGIGALLNRAVRRRQDIPDRPVAVEALPSEDTARLFAGWRRPLLRRQQCAESRRALWAPYHRMGRFRDKEPSDHSHTFFEGARKTLPLHDL